VEALCIGVSCEEEIIASPNEVLTRGMPSRVEQWGICAALRVLCCYLDRFSAMAVKAGSGEILQDCGTSLSERHNVVHSIGHVLPLLCGMAALTERPSALTHLQLHSMRERAAAWPQSDALNLGAPRRVAHESV
jgi:hypothetical protein